MAVSTGIAGLAAALGFSDGAKGGTTKSHAGFGARHLASRKDGATPGCYSLRMSDSDYHQAAGVSSTGLKQMMRSPAHYRAWKERRIGSDDTAARRFGRAVHCRILEPLEWDARYVIWRGKDRRGKDYQQFAAAHPTKQVLLSEEFSNIDGCAESLLSSADFPFQGYLDGIHLADGQCVLEPARTEFVIIWVDELTGITCRIKLDAVSPEPLIAVDVKTCGDARPQAFAADIARLHYDLQAAFYLEGVRRFFGSDAPFIFAAVEAEPPHANAFYVLPPAHDFVKNGRRKFRHALDTLAKCEADQRWPAYAQGLTEPVMTPWMAF